MPLAQIRNILLFAASGGLAVAVVSRDAWNLWWLQHATYFTVLIAMGVWLYRIASYARGRWESPLHALRDTWAELALAALAMTALFVAHDWQFKVLSDETNFVSVGRSLAFEWRFDFPDYGKFFYGNQHGLTYVFDKRPPLFPFCLGLVDGLTGYRVRNIWYLNGAILGLTVVVAALALRPRLGRAWSMIGVVWALANPIVMLTASAAGVEPLLCLVWLIQGACFFYVLEAPSEASLGLLVANTVMVGLTRFEGGPLAAMSLAAAVALSPERTRLVEWLRDDALVWVTPAAALPVAIQRMRIKDYYQGLTGKPFGLEHVLSNLDNWRIVLRDGGRFYPYSTVVTVVEALAVLALAILVLRGKVGTTRAQRGGFFVFAALTGAFFALYSAYFWGQPSNPASARFYALPLFFAALAVPAVLARIEAVRERTKGVAVVAALVFAQAFPASHNRAFANAFNWRKQHEVVADYVLPQIPAKQLLLVTAVPSQFVVYDVGALSFANFHAHREAVLRELDRKLYDEILFVQEIGYADKQPTAQTRADADLVLETLVERQYGGSSFLRISRLKR